MGLRAGTARKIVAGSAIVLVVAFFLGVNTFPIVTNDSLTYLDHSHDLTGEGWVQGGYRQMGYPLVLSVERLVSGVVGTESLLFSVVVQRLLLFGGLIYAISLWRWKAFPLVVVLLTPELLVYPNFILTEGLTVPLSLILACVTAHYFMEAEVAPSATVNSGARRVDRMFLLAGLGCGFVLVMILARFPLAVFGVVPMGISAHSLVTKSSSRKHVTGVTLALIALAGSFSVFAALENQEEFGVFFPTTNGANAEYWGAWRLTFGLHPENQAAEDLADYYDDGSPHPLIARLVEEYPDYSEREDAFDVEIENLLRISGTSLARERLFSFLGALRGGRHNDLSTYSKTSLRSTSRTLDEAILRNTYGMENGVRAFAERYNDGRLPEAVITSPAFPILPSPGLQGVLSVAVPASLIGLSALAALKRRYLVGAMFLLPALVMSAAMGWLLLDNVRFLLPTSVFAVAGLSAVWASPPRRDSVRRF